ncbi:MAG: class I fructose-bisphosphate aldolase, partial [Anaerolineae bacterium]
IRLSRLFDGNRAVVVAIDHAQTFGPIPGLVDFRAAAASLAEADGVLLAPQMMRFTGNLFHRRAGPVAIVRVAWTTRHCVPWAYGESETVEDMPLPQAVQAGADMVLAPLVLKTGSERRDAENVRVFTRVANEAHALGLPVIGEVFATPEVERDRTAFADYVVRVTRIVCELGADAVKTFYVGERFAEVAAGVPIPVLTLGAEKLEREIQALELAERSVQAGAQGVVFGRNVIQARDPGQFLRGLKAVVKDGATAAEAAARFGL